MKTAGQCNTDFTIPYPVGLWSQEAGYRQHLSPPNSVFSDVTLMALNQSAMLEIFTS